MEESGEETEVGGGECGKVRKKVERKQRLGGGGNVGTVNEEESGEKE